jgi:hypothetical protein
MGKWLSGRLGVSSWVGRRWVQTAHALEELPETSEALASGELYLDKVVELARYATPKTDSELISWARRVSVGLKLGYLRRLDWSPRLGLQRERQLAHMN